MRVFEQLLVPQIATQFLHHSHTRLTAHKKKLYSSFHPNASDSITDGLLVKKSMDKCPKTLKTIKYEPSYVLRRSSGSATFGNSRGDRLKMTVPHSTEAKSLGEKGRGDSGDVEPQCMGARVDAGRPG